jgi:biotin--protein ligase
VLQHQQQQQGGVHAWWGSAAFFRHLRASTMGHVLLSTPSIPSTQEFMRAHTHVLPKGAVLVADQQTRGKGEGVLRCALCCVLWAARCEPRTITHHHQPACCLSLRCVGRGGNVWTSPPGCLMFSAFRQLQVSGAAAPFINYVVCLAVARGIKEATAHLLPVRCLCLLGVC